MAAMSPFGPPTAQGTFTAVDAEAAPADSNPAETSPPHRLADKATMPRRCLFRRRVAGSLAFEQDVLPRKPIVFPPGSQYHPL
jgi:hypothetical protein